MKADDMTHVWSGEEVTSFKLLLTKILQNLRSEEDLKEARIVAKLLTEINSDDAEAWYFLGCLNGALGQFDEAKNNLFRSLELDGNEFPNYTELAHICMNQGNFKEGIQWGYRALKCNPEDVLIYCANYQIVRH